jgi:tetratricopeptide (TPR) repeat protein
LLGEKRHAVMLAESMVDSCPAATTLLAYAEGRLSDPDREQAELHLDGCDTCLAVVAELGRFATPRSTDDASRYDVGPQLARGGMGRILRAWDRKLGRNVALKTVADDRSALVQRLRREMALTARLQHPAIVPIYDAGRLPTGEPYYAMRWIEGRTLRQLVDECRDAHARLALLPIVLAVAEAIAYAHDQRIIHRDLKPSNVVVGTFGETVVLDWGLAKDLLDASDLDLGGDASEPDHEPAMTADGQVMGTPGYIAPEQARGESVDARADVYAVGVILLELATGRTPKGGELGPLYVEAARNVPADLLAIMRRATHGDLGSRYRDGTELVGDLRRYAQGRLVQAHDYTIAQRIRRFVARHRVPVALATAFVAALASGGSWAVARVVAERDAADEARRLAQEQQARAEERRDAAQSLVQFMVDDLTTALGTIGRGDILGAAATAVLGYFEGVEAADGTDLLQEAQTLHLVGGALTMARDIPGAGRAYQSALDRALAAAERGEPQAQWWASSSRERLSYVRTMEGDHAGARALLDQVLAEAKHGIASGEQPAKWAELAGPVYLSLYYRDMDAGDVESAMKWIDEGDRLVATPVGDAQAWEASTGDLRLAMLQVRARTARDAGDVAGYAAAARTFVSLARGRYEAARDDAGLAANYVAALMENASASELQDDPRRAYEDLLVALELATDIAARDPTNVSNRALLGTTLQFLGKNARARDALDEAATYFGRAETLAQEIIELAPDEVDLLRTQLASAGKYLCLVHEERGAHEPALQACLRSLAALQRAFTLDPAHAHRDQDVSSVSAIAARAAMGSGRVQEARDHAEQSLTAARRVVETSDAERDRVALADALVARSGVAAREGDAAAARAAADEARRILDGIAAPRDPGKVAALRDELGRNR